MHRAFRRRRYAIVAATIVGCLMAGPASARGRSEAFSIQFAQTFATAPCPDAAPAGYLCLRVTGTSAERASRASSFRRDVMFDYGKFDPKHPTCLPDETSGVLTLPGGTLSIRAPGSVCLVDGTASYDVIVTGGTDRYAGASGMGHITVPPPASESTGTEYWQLRLF